MTRNDKTLVMLERTSIFSKKKDHTCIYFFVKKISQYRKKLTYLSSLLKPFPPTFFLIQFTIFSGIDNTVIFGFIQGTRTNKDAPWTDDSGNPLPYMPANVVNSDDASSRTLILIPGGFSAINVTIKNRAFVLCEI